MHDGIVQCHTQSSHNQHGTMKGNNFELLLFFTLA